MEYNKRIVISGYYGFDNIGDEAVLYSIIQALKKEFRGKEVHITVLSNKPEKTAQLYSVEAINRWDIKAVSREIKKCHMLISGGGSLLQDVTSVKTIPYYLLVVKMAQWYKKKIVFYSQGIGPVTKPFSKYLIKKIVNKVNYIFVRDRDSKKTLVDMGVTKPPIEVVADPVLGMSQDRESIVKMEGLLRQYKEKENKTKGDQDLLKVGIYLRSWKSDAVVIDKITILSHLLYKEGVELFFIPMHQPEDKSFIEGMPPLGIPYYMITDSLSVEEMFSLTGQMDIVISMRLHALIMAKAQGIPCVALSYDPKVDAFMEEIGNRHCFNVETFTPNEVVESLMIQCKNIAQKDNYKEQVDKLLIEKAYKPAKLIREMMGE